MGEGWEGNSVMFPQSQFNQILDQNRSPSFLQQVLLHTSYVEDTENAGTLFLEYELHNICQGICERTYKYSHGANCSTDLKFFNTRTIYTVLISYIALNLYTNTIFYYCYNRYSRKTSAFFICLTYTQQE